MQWCRCFIQQLNSLVSDSGFSKASISLSNTHTHTRGVAGTVRWFEESSQWRSGAADAGAADVTGGARCQQVAAEHGGEWLPRQPFEQDPSFRILQERRLCVWQGLGTDEETLMEILCTKSGKKLQEIYSAYSQRKEECQMMI